MMIMETREWMRSLKAKGKGKKKKKGPKMNARKVFKTKQKKRHERRTLKSMRWCKNQNIVLKPK